MVKKLSELKPGESGVITDTHGSGWVRKRLLDMGVTKSAPVIFKKSAPLGDPVQVNLRGYELSLRKSEAELVDVEVSGVASVDGERKKERLEEKEAKRKAREEKKEAKRKAREERAKEKEARK